MSNNSLILVLRHGKTKQVLLAMLCLGKLPVFVTINRTFTVEQGGMLQQHPVSKLMVFVFSFHTKQRMNLASIVNSEGI